MKFSDFTTMGFKNLWRRKLRTILTMVGVAIGAFSIVIMLSLGLALQESYTKQLEEWGSLTLIRVNSNSYDYDAGVVKKTKLDDTTVEKFKKIEHVRAASPLLELSGRLKSGKYQAYLNLVGIDPDAVQYFDLPKVASGEMISNSNPSGILFSSDIFFYNPKSRNAWMEESHVDVMKDKIKITFDDTNDPKVTPQYEKVNVQGVMQEAKSEMGYSSYVPIEQAKKWYKEQQKKAKGSKKTEEFTYSSVLVSVDDTNFVADVQNQIKEMGFSTYSRVDELDQVNGMSNTLQLVLGGIGAVSLFVSAIGIANTMIMSIYERTKEIGVMKVLGCVVTDIRKLFLFEAGIIGLLGGFLGLGLSYGISVLLNKFAPEIGAQIGITSGSQISIIPPWLAISSIVFSIAIGMLSGLYPAIKATKIKAIEAMRNAG